MAVIWAKQAGTWTTASLWAFWNENTQQIEDYGQAPQIGDEVYLNGFQVNAPSQDINIGDGFVSNESLTIGSYTITAGGYLYCTGAGGHVYTMGLRAESGYVFYCVTGSNGATVNWMGDIYVSTTYAIRIDQKTTPNYVFQGNISLKDGCSLFNSYHLNAGIINSMTINGNITNDGNQSIQAYLKNNLTNNNISTIRINGNIGKGVSITPTYLTFANVIINGRWELTYNETITTFTVHTLLAYNSSYIRTTTTTVNGSIYYTGTHLGVTYVNLNINAPNDFRWVDMTDIRINPFIIVTDWDFANEVQYPNENKVVAGTPYAFDQKVGTFGVDYPPETVVLKDYVYDNGERTGTLENEVTVNVGCTNPQDVRKDIPLANMGTVGTMVIPAPENVLKGTIYDNGTEGTLESQSTADYPAEDKVLIGTSYDHYNMTGTLEPGGDNPQESDVRFGVPYNHNLNTGKAHIPSSEDVRKNVPVEDTVGQIVIPRTSEVKKDVEFDVDSVGTLESVIETNNTINVYRKSSSI